MVNLLPTLSLAQSILKRKFPSVDKPLQKKAPQKGPLKIISPGAYFRNFTVFDFGPVKLPGLSRNGRQESIS